MSSDAVRLYVDALKARQKAEKSVSEVSDFIKYVSNALERDSNNFSFDGLRRYGSSPRATPSSFEGVKWPTAKSLQDLLIHWDETKKQVAQAWDNLASDDRAILPSPERRG